ncbi:TlpA family protein disulfide reductase [Azoarcus sp. L1K30]|uniref:TlpA family protein disulfide reductase n=1 Tax=Azoarcus sp. L1K30 TaxID=2820277 RepID=UPI001B832E0E|nr:TlpA disulfide reductase family protein [Azoarcus sp. L1K30]MBR0566688.1 TlpA family protein disulfide reductase [Azoarcus sp. L1K30]
MRPYVHYLLVAIVAGLAGTAGYFANREMGTRDALHENSATAATTALMALRLPDTEGSIQPVEQWRGKVIVANFWATWCPPCRKEIPDFVAASRGLGEYPVQFVGISIDMADKVKAFKREFDVPYPLLIASPDVLGLASGFGNAAQGLPFTVILDRNGVARHVKLGALNQSELEGKIRALLDEKS